MTERLDVLKVLVVDDEDGIRMGVARALRHFTVQLAEVDDVLHGFEVIGVETGEQALELIQDERPDLVLLDIMLPGISGLDVLGRLEGEDYDHLVVMITAYATIETAITATKRGAYDVLAKPFNPQELKTVVRKAAHHLLARRKAATLAREKHQVRFQFISVLAHELKSPLAAVEGYLCVLRERSLGDQIEAYEKIVSRTIARCDGMRKLILDLLDLTRLESGQRQRELEPVDAVEVAQTSIETMEPMAQERGITITLHADAPVAIMADRGELEIVCNNLVSNAVKYNRDAGQVDVMLTREGNALEIRVKDTGIGMSEEEQACLFGEFVRIKNAKTRHVMGSGLGLSILKKIVVLYDGNIRVESAPDVGSTFIVRLKVLRV